MLEKLRRKGNIRGASRIELAEPFVYSGDFVLFLDTGPQCGWETQVALLLLTMHDFQVRPQMTVTHADIRKWGVRRVLVSRSRRTTISIELLRVHLVVT